MDEEDRKKLGEICGERCPNPGKAQMEFSQQMTEIMSRPTSVLEQSYKHHKELGKDIAVLMVAGLLIFGADESTEGKIDILEKVKKKIIEAERMVNHAD